MKYSKLILFWLFVNSVLFAQIVDTLIDDGPWPYTLPDYESTINTYYQDRYFCRFAWPYLNMESPVIDLPNNIHGLRQIIKTEGGSFIVLTAQSCSEPVCYCNGFLDVGINFQVVEVFNYDPIEDTLMRHKFYFAEEESDLVEGLLLPYFIHSIQSLSEEEILFSPGIGYSPQNLCFFPNTTANIYAIYNFSTHSLVVDTIDSVANIESMAIYYSNSALLDTFKIIATGDSLHVLGYGDELINSVPFTGQFRHYMDAENRMIIVGDKLVLRIDETGNVEELLNLAWEGDERIIDVYVQQSSILILVRDVISNHHFIYSLSASFPSYILDITNHFNKYTFLNSIMSYNGEVVVAGEYLNLYGVTDYTVIKTIDVSNNIPLFYDIEIINSAYDQPFIYDNYQSIYIPNYEVEIKNNSFEAVYYFENNLGIPNDISPPLGPGESRTYTRDFMYIGNSPYCFRSCMDGSIINHKWMDMDYDNNLLCLDNISGVEDVYSQAIEVQGTLITTDYNVEYIAIYNISGHKLWEGKGNVQYSIEDWPRGFYFCRFLLAGDQNYQVVKIIK